MNYYIYYWKYIEYIHGDLAPETTKELDKDYAFVGTVHFPTSRRVNNIENLEKIFMHYNADDNPLSTLEGQEKLKALGVNHTSMSVGDIIQFAGVTYIVDIIGFKEIKLDEWAQEHVLEAQRMIGRI